MVLTHGRLESGKGVCSVVTLTGVVAQSLAKEPY